MTPTGVASKHSHRGRFGPIKRIIDTKFASSESAAARAWGIKQNTLYGMLHDGHDPHLSLLLKIVRGSGRQLDELLIYNRGEAYVLAKGYNRSMEQSSSSE